ncbi:Tetratricopeptide-like helical [Madurella fahalii]|uniref:Tetratricopeptide-like helical n=1 Tax=Madurella fahalii TaxID=1157608 RepID=A0ABQ0GHJ8_9PEZI
MDLFITSGLPSSSYIHLTSPASLLSSLALEDGSVHDDFVHFLQRAQALNVRILPLVYEPRLDAVGQDGATGRVNQRVWNSRMRFAFKRFRPSLDGAGLSEMRLRRLQYKAAANEIAILSCPAIRDHPNIALFIGVGFEVVQSPMSVRPVLVYSKATGGDLATFISESQDVDEDLILGMCGEVIKGLDALHSCNVVHGDIKPTNVLIWRQSEPEPSLAVAVADFGFSSFATSCDELVRVSRSQPWEAPEWHTGECTLYNAKKMDVYSFGLLCFWLFFKGETLTELGLPSATVDSAFLQSNPSATDAVQSLKRDGNSMLRWSLTLLQKRQDTAPRTRGCLQQVFQLTLARDPEARDVSLENILSLLSGATGMEEPRHPTEVSRVNIPDGHGSLELEKIFFDLEACDYRVHSFLADGLVRMADAGDCCHPCAQNAAFQLALCYRLGFGVARSDLECSVWLARSGRRENDLAAALERIRNAEPNASFIAHLSSMGYRNDLTSRYHLDGILGAAIDVYRSTLRARNDALGPNHFSTTRLRDTLVKLLSFNDDNREALDLALEGVQTPGLASADLRDMKYTLSCIYSDLGEITKSEEILSDILQIPLDSDGGHATTDRLDHEVHLADILISKRCFKEASELSEKVANESIAELGPEHPTSLAAKRTLVQAYTGAGDTTRALTVSEELFRVQQFATTLQNPSPRLVQDVALLGVLRFQTGNKGGALDCYNAIQRWISHDKKNATFATNAVSNYASTLIEAGVLKDAQGILEALLRECDKILGSESAESAMVMGNLAAAFHIQAQWESAEPLAQRVVETRRTVLGLSHPHTATSMRNYREVLLAQGKVAEAVQVAGEEISCVKGATGATRASIMDTLLHISGAFASARAFNEAISFLEELKVLLTRETDDEPRQGALSAALLEAICYLELQQAAKAREALYRLLTGFTVPFKEDMNEIIPGLLRLVDICLESDYKVDAEQILAGAAILSRKSQAVTAELRARVDATLSRYFEAEGIENAAISFRPHLLRGEPVAKEDI